MTMTRLALRLVGRVRPQSAGAAAVAPTTLLGWYARKGAVPAIRGLVRLPLLARARLPFFLGSRTRIDYGRQLFLGRSVQIGSGVVLNAFSRDGVHIGDGVTIRENAWIQCTSHPANPGVGLWVGDGTYIGPRATIGVGGPIRIGAGCQFGANVTLIAENHATSEAGASAHDVVRKGIVIGEGTWLGHGVTIVDGVVLGPRCVVGAGAVVTRSFPAGSKVAGVPARLLPA
jgi:acetyltransferase-like isoleucine patch superfamily enzyme